MNALAIKSTLQAAHLRIQYNAIGQKCEEEVDFAVKQLLC
jgi:hypothetical protein